MKDCVVVETYVDAVRRLRDAGLASRMIFVPRTPRISSRRASFPKPDLAREFAGVELGFAPNLAAAKHALCLERHRHPRQIYMEVEFAGRIGASPATRSTYPSEGLGIDSSTSAATAVRNDLMRSLSLTTSVGRRWAWISRRPLRSFER